jgi:ABC-type multidrug transport system ATPase subunit
MTSILIAESIGKKFRDASILTSARLEAREGTVTFVAGRNGAGKSTLLKIVAGVLEPDHGSIRYRGAVLLRPRLHRLAQLGVFYLPDRDLLSPSFAVRDQLEIMHARFGGQAPEAIVDELGLTDVVDRKPGSLSGGERRRAEVALAMVRGPVCVIADEPLRGIDPKDQDELVSLFRRMADRGTAVVVSGHETGSLMAASDEVCWVTSGTTYGLGSPAEALDQERFRREYLTGSWT